MPKTLDEVCKSYSPKYTFDIVTDFLSNFVKIRLSDQNGEHTHVKISLLELTKHKPEQIVKDIITLHERYLKEKEVNKYENL